MGDRILEPTEASRYGDDDIAGRSRLSSRRDVFAGEIAYLHSIICRFLYICSSEAGFSKEMGGEGRRGACEQAAIVACGRKLRWATQPELVHSRHPRRRR